MLYHIYIYDAINETLICIYELKHINFNYILLGIVTII
jgi:hypothetical protein